MIDAAYVSGWRAADTMVEYRESDLILYHLGVGAGAIAATDLRGLDYAWEEGLKVLPSVASVLGGREFFFHDPACRVSEADTVHGAQSIEIFADLATAGRLRSSSWIEAIHDKGADRGAIVEQVWALTDLEDRPICRSRSSVFVRGAGGFGGSDDHPKLIEMPSNSPAIVHSLDTRPEQALLYRLVNDRSRLHVDPDFARSAGFDRPILHGLATFGGLTLLLVVHHLRNDPRPIRRVECRFTGPVYPGERLDLHAWRLSEEEILFQGWVQGRLVVDGGRLTLGAPGSRQIGLN